MRHAAKMYMHRVTYNFCASSNILLVHKLKERKNMPYVYAYKRGSKGGLKHASRAAGTIHAYCCRHPATYVTTT
jgi:hypothetical protein